MQSSVGGEAKEVEKHNFFVCTSESFWFSELSMFIILIRRKDINIIKKQKKRKEKNPKGI